MPTLKMVKSRRLMPDWGDSLGLASFQGHIHAVAQARLAIYPSSKHYVFDTSGNIVAAIDSPLLPNGEMVVSVRGDTLIAYGGTSDATAYQFDPAVAGLTAGSWSVLDDSYSAAIGSREVAVGIDGPDGNHYVFGGWPNDTYARTSTFQPGSWVSLGTLPNSIKKISANAIAVVGNEIILIGGATNATSSPNTGGLYNADVNGEIWGYNVLTDVFRLIHTDKQLFGSIWLDAAASDTHVYVSKGLISPTHLTSFGGSPPRAGAGNVPGVVYASKSDLTTWTELNLIDGRYFRHETHRGVMVWHAGKVYQVAGYNDNTMWRIDE